MASKLALLNLVLLHAHELHEIDHSQGFWCALPELLKDVIGETLFITAMVIGLMAFIELINVSSSGKLMAKLKNYPIVQLLIACLLGAIPGCAGGFAVVSMFTHDIISFGALIGGMVSTFGDEAFFLFAKSPKWAAVLTAVLFALGFGSGLLVNLWGKIRKHPVCAHEFPLHDMDSLEHHHHTGECHGLISHIKHFFQDHLWNHVIKEHLFGIFLWTFGVLLFLKLTGYFFDINDLLHDHSWAMFVMLLLAVLIGFIPESGPNLIFIVMFMEGTVPFAILLANSIAQNGHAGLPLLAHSRKSFFAMKGYTLGLGLLCGAIMLLL